MGMTVRNNQNVPAALTQVLRVAQLASQAPHSLLLEETHCMTDLSLHGNVNNFLRAELLSLRAQLGLEGQQSLVLALGQNNYIEYPDELFENGFVIGLDADVDAMKSVESRLGKNSDHAVSLEIEASLVGNEIVEGAIAAVEKYSEWSDEMLADLIRLFQEINPERELPIEDEAVDMYAALEFVECSLAKIINAVMVGYLWPKYGQRASRSFLSEPAPGYAGQKMKGNLLMEASNRLYHRLMQFQLAEARRVLKPGGLALVTSHALRFNADIYYQQHFRFPWSRMFPADQMMLDIGVENAEGQADVRIGQRAEGIVVSGIDSLSAMTAELEGFEVVDTFSYWGVQRLGHPELGCAVYQLDNAVVLKRE
ncbi:MAG: hypothetical protein ABH823_00475 [bacterium]